MNYIEKVKLELIGEEDEDSYLSKFITASFEYFKHNKISKQEYSSFYDHIKKNYVYDKVELHKIIKLKWGYECSEFIDNYINKTYKEKRKKEQKQQKLENRAIEFSKENIKDLLGLRKRDDATELIVNEILNNNRIYTLRHDDKEEVWIYKDGVYIPEGKSYIKEFIRDVLGRLYTTHLANLVIDKIQIETFIQDEDFFINEDPNLVCLQNGIYDLKRKRLLPFNEKYFFFQKLPIYYDKKAKCRNIMKFFNSTLKKEDDKTIQEFFGFCLYRDLKWEKSFMFNGSGRNGKSKTLELIKRFLGAKNCSNISLQRLENKNVNFDIAELHNKLANISGDLSPTALTETGEFKSLTGHEMMTAQRKFKTPISFVNYAKFIFCANELPRTSDVTPAFFMRWIIIDFPYTFYLTSEFEKNKTDPFCKLAEPSIIEKLTTQEELNGLFLWAVEGFERLKKQDGFSNDLGANDIKNLWIRKSDSFAAFCMDHLEEEVEGAITKQDLTRFYSIYCRVHKVRNYGEKHIKSVLTRTFGCWETRKNDNEIKISYWEGIKFKENITDMLDKIKKKTYSKNNTEQHCLSM